MLLEFIKSLRFAFIVVVDAEIGKVDDVADRRLHHHAGRFRDRVRYAEENSIEVVGDFHLVAVLNRYDFHLRRVRKVILRVFR